MSVENSVPRNVYEGSVEQPDIERDRLRTFDVPTRASIEALGSINQINSVLDIGSGENPGLHEYVNEHRAHYVAFDVRHSALVEQRLGGVAAVEGDARHLPFADASLDIIHTRFVLGHFHDEERLELIDEALRVMKPEGKAIFIDYDWTVMHGSEVVNQVRDFTLKHISIFDAAYGSRSKEEIQSVAGHEYSTNVQRITPPKLSDYQPLLAIRQITLVGLTKQGSDQSLHQQAETIFDAAEREALSQKPPGYHMPDMVAVTVKKL